MTNDVSQVILWQEDSVYGVNRKIQWDARNDDRVYVWEIDIK